jgi:hypothetical protein
MTHDALNYPSGTTSDMIDNAWGTQMPIFEEEGERCIHNCPLTSDCPECSKECGDV